MEDISVRVAVRIRPQMRIEELDNCHVCTTVTPGEPQVVLGHDKAFTFDNVFGIGCSQEDVYSKCVNELINGCLKGYNATILAYGQTGSGKTYTMGTGFDVSISEDEKGIIPRAVHQLFDGINSQRNEAVNRGSTPPDFKIVAQFMELYNEEIIDLIDPGSEETRKCVKIHEDQSGTIYTIGLASCPVTTATETLQCLRNGALSRTTASTNMNAQSSRSHAIFTLHIKMHRVIEFEASDDSEKPPEAFETLMAKLHFVDLAGSERLKRTGATGERAREGISINCGLLSLGNVISALGDKTRKATHVPYRDSKLTRLLQDSLGGNSQTLMIACVSPSDRDFMETLNTLKYANRAKNIRNKVSINQDKSTQTIAMLRREIQQLQLELIEYKQRKRIISEDGEEQVNDMFHENMLLEAEVNNLRSRLKALQETLDHQTQRVANLLAEKAAGEWISSGVSSESDMGELVKGYLKEIEDLRVKLLESDQMCSQLRKQLQKTQSQARSSSSLNKSLLGMDVFEVTNSPNSPFQLISEAKEEIKQLTKQAKALEALQVNEHDDTKESKETDDEKEKEDSSEVSSVKMNGDLQSNGQTDEEEEESETDESDLEDNKSSVETSIDLAQLTQDISMKQKLIEALEQSQQRLKLLKQHYEEKLLLLEHKIRETENERDRVLANLGVGNKSKKSVENAKKVKDEFEKKLQSLHNELKKMQVVKKEHAKVMRNQAQYERQIGTLKSDLAEMKKTKVRLMNKMKEESHKHMQSDQRRNREIAQLKKQSRQKENQIRNLEAENRLNKNVLKRKQEELAAMRKNNRPMMSDKVAGRVHQKSSLNSTFTVHKRPSFSPKVAKSQWQNIEKSINQLVINKQSVSCMERDMERYIKEREKLSKKLEELQKKKNAAYNQNKSQEIIQDYDDNIETLKANIDYCQGNIAECQSFIIQMEESKEDIDVLDVEKMPCNFIESKYLLSKLINMTINQTFQVFQKDAALKEMEEKLKQSRSNNTFHMQLMEKLVENGNSEVLEFVISSENDDLSESPSSSRSVSPVDGSVSESVHNNAVRHSPDARERKRRRLTGLPSAFEADVTVNKSNLTSAGSLPSVAESSSTMMPPKMAWSYGPALQQELDLDKTLTSSTSLHETTVSDISPPDSPSAPRKDNVFNRLTNGSFRLNKAVSGVIQPFTVRSLSKNSPVFCTHVAEGHSRAILSVVATDDVMFTSSKDRTVKMWDLCTGKEIQSLGGHPNDVVAVRYNEYSRLAFSVSNAYIKVWDVRENPLKCVQTLSSSGATNSAPDVTSWRTFKIPIGETWIQDLAINQCGTTLFSAANTVVCIWDLRMYKAVGKLKLNGGFQARIMCLAADNRSDKNVVVTGSKNDYIKVFNVPEGATGIYSADVKFKTPHCDVIQSLALSNDILFSASRDKCIKKWDLKKNVAVKSLNRAHKNWIMAISFFSNNDFLCSGCGNGVLKLWSVETTKLLGEVIAHGSSINAIATNRSCIFTASSDCSVCIWNMKNNNDLSPEYNEYES